MRGPIATFVACLGAVALSASCNGSGSFGKLQETVTQINDKQDTILSRLDTLEEKVGKGGRGSGRDARRPPGPDPKATYKVAVGDAHTKGPETAKVTIVEWSDFECPFCKRVLPTFAELTKAYGDDLRIAFKHNPLPMHARAMPAALAAEAAGRQGKFWEMHDHLFTAKRGDLSDENIEKWAKELGLDLGKFKKDVADPALKKKITDQQAQGAKLGARGTPAFFVNGRFLSGAKPVAEFKTVIDEEIKKVDKLLAAGTPKNKIYEKVISSGKAGV